MSEREEKFSMEFYSSEFMCKGFPESGFPCSLSIGVDASTLRIVAPTLCLPHPPYARFWLAQRFPVMKKQQRVRYAVIGLGHIAQIAVLPAFKHAKNSQLAALVSSDLEKSRILASRYKAPAYHYDELEAAIGAEEIDAVYIALPNSQHREFTVRSARAGAHVLCEKPMAGSSKDGRAMIAACDKARVQLMIAYRLHFAPGHVEAIRLARAGKLGDLRFISSVFGMQVMAENIRTSAADQGGPLFDLGVYCINAARYLFGSEPVEVTAFTESKKGDKRFAEVEEMASAILRFPGERVAQFTCSFDSPDLAALDLVGTKGRLRMEPAFDYAGPIRWELSLGGSTKKRSFTVGDQFAPELIHFSDCVLHGRRPEPDGNEGLADVRIVEAIFKSAKTGRSVKIAPVQPQKPIRTSQAMTLPPVKKPRIVKAHAPHS
jgi:glucose-fructose oxidoreductase